MTILACTNSGCMILGHGIGKSIDSGTRLSSLEEAAVSDLPFRVATSDGQIYEGAFKTLDADRVVVTPLGKESAVFQTGAAAADTIRIDAVVNVWAIEPKQKRWMVVGTLAGAVVDLVVLYEAFDDPWYGD